MSLALRVQGSGFRVQVFRRSGAWSGRRARLAAEASFAAVHDEPEGAEAEDGDGGAGAEGGDDGEAVLAAARVVLVAEEHDLLGERADLAVGGFDEAEVDVAGGELDAVEVARDLAVGSEEHDRAA